MLAYCNAEGFVIATHDEAQNVPLSAYPGATRILSVGSNVFAGTSMAAPDAADLHAYASQVKWQKEYGGINVPIGGGNLLSVPTNDRTRLMIAGARLKADAEPNYVVESFKVTSSFYVTLTAPMIIAISDAVDAHVQACFTTNREVDEKITSGEITSYGEIDEAFEA